MRLRRGRSRVTLGRPYAGGGADTVPRLIDNQMSRTREFEYGSIQDFSTKESPGAGR